MSTPGSHDARPIEREGDSLAHDCPIVQDGGTSKWLAFDCPCRERHRVLINLDNRRHPSWVVTAAAPLTVSPSVDGTRAGRRCHYIIRA
ncbi:DUF6527 family protein [Arthrobacter sp. U41]|uniref:DUF6527 family protein n=1 Tax=Arthrobacter sp. U41 TaxID=1849032 RepID=UPI003FA40BE7